MSDPTLDRQIGAVRRFNRFYTQRIGVLQEGLLDSTFSLAEARVLYELAQDGGAVAADLARALGLDPGYLSRILRGFRRRGLIERTPAPDDRRQRLLRLTAAGESALSPLDQASKAATGELLAPLAAGDRRVLVRAMERIAGLLGAASRPGAYVLRPHRPGDFGWIVERHGALYAAEYGWDARFEAMVASIAAGFLANFDPRREACWIAERDGERVGSVALIAETTRLARLRVLLVEPAARGSGLGASLVEECLDFAGRAGYGAVTLSTYSILAAARRLYEAAGFRLVEQHPEQAFGHDLTGETWTLALSSRGAGD